MNQPDVHHGPVDRHQLGLDRGRGPAGGHLDVEADKLAAPVEEGVQQAVLEVPTRRIPWRPDRGRTW